jgi:type I site-specific restriction endonuclease
MKNTVLNRMSRLVAVLALSVTATTVVVAQTSVDQTFARELKLVEGLKVYNNQLAQQLDGQQKAKAEILASISQSKELSPQVGQVLDKMLVSLESFIRGDLPFHNEDRLGSIADLKALMANSEASNSDRFRNIMDIYTVELEYGNTAEAYPSVISLNGVETPVDMLRVGRLGLYYQTKDKKMSGMWDRTNGAWKSLPDSVNRKIRKAIKVAAKTIAPELMSLTIEAPEGP